MTALSSTTFHCAPSANSLVKRWMISIKQWKWSISRVGLLFAACLTLACTDGLKSHLWAEESSDFAGEALIALESIEVEQLNSALMVLADDSLEGREAGKAGGRAAGNYIMDLLDAYGAEPAGERGSYVQEFGNGYRNILAKFEGSHDELKREVILIGAHYDHVGYGNRANSFGPIGRVHNGADDNGSGTAGLLEIAQALSLMETKPARSIVLAFFDAEEMGLLGSKHWVSHPTMELPRIRLMINIDMIGRLRADRLEVYGTRTGNGLRRLAVEANADRLTLAFNWDMKDDSDHHPFFARQIPVLMYHTGLHGQYHRPSDDIETVNQEGIRLVTKMTLRTALLAAESPELPEYRRDARVENDSDRREYESFPAPTNTDRLGVSLSESPDQAEPNRVVISRISTSSPAAEARLIAGDRISAINNAAVRSPLEFRQAILSSPEDCLLTRLRADATTGELVQEDVAVSLRGKPTRVGLTWTTDRADPSIALIRNVVEYSPAYIAGLREGDRIYAVNDQRFTNSKALLEILKSVTGESQILVERDGKLEVVGLTVSTQAASQGP